jgi:catechol 2,3-dioxygenase-like lactoylglutathione lyase family enzyme
MNIVGIDQAILGLEEMTDARRFLRDFGLGETETGQTGAVFEALDGSQVVLRAASDTTLPMPVGGAVGIRETIWGVKSRDDLDRIGAELSRDRQVALGPDSVLRAVDDSGFSIGFRVTKRHAFEARAALVNAAGLPPQRAPDTRIDFSAPHRARSMGHIVFWVPDVVAARSFYTSRLGFRLTDSFKNGSCFMRAAGSNDHHNLFLIKRENAPAALHHIEFHFTDFNEVMMGGKRMSEKGWQTQNGPGRHTLGSNYFWYFKSPCGGAFELAADMDYVTDAWQPGEWDYRPEIVAAWSTTFTLPAQ